ncbi:MAG: flagellar brake domain-containing protein [Desulfamplus sp.]|nr:flagellar brake domain-containing protein [Desulfamplus sp.]
MKTFFRPISGLFGKKSGDDSQRDEEKKDSSMDDHTLAKNHCKLFNALQDVQSKLEKLESAKDKISEERFSSLHKQYSDFINQKEPVLVQVRHEIDQRISSYVNGKKEAAQRFTEIKKNIAEEAKLLEAGVISKDEYLEKLKTWKPEEKECAEAYKSVKKKIELLKDAKENRYVEPEPEEDEEESAAPRDEESPKDDNNGSQPPKQIVQKPKEQVLFGKEVDIAVAPGTKLDIKIEGIAIPVTAIFVGTERYEYIQITPPSPYNTVKGKLFPGNIIEFQTIFKGKLYLFEAGIIEHITKPVRAVILDFPEKLTTKEIRSSDRVSCMIPSTLFFRGKGKECIINDISPLGCGVDVTYEPSEKNYIARTNDTVKIECCFPGDQECYTLNGIIRNVKKKQLHLIYGIQLTEVDDEVKKVIIQYVSRAGS